MKDYLQQTRTLEKTVKWFTGMSLYEFMEICQLPGPVEVCRHILTLTTSEKEKRYLLRELGNDPGRWENRQPWMAAHDLLSSWLLEDAVIYYLRDNWVPIEKTGVDKDRKFRINKPTAAPDFNIKYASSLQNFDYRLPIELVSDYTGFWQREGYMDFRYDKAGKCLGNGAVTLGLDLVNEQFIVFRMKSARLGEKYENKRQGGKLCRKVWWPETASFHPLRYLYSYLNLFLDLAVEVGDFSEYRGND